MILIDVNVLTFVVVERVGEMPLIHFCDCEAAAGSMHNAHQWRLINQYSGAFDCQIRTKMQY